MLEKIKSVFGQKVLDTMIHVNVKLKEAQNQGQHIFAYDKYSRGAKDYFSLARRIISGYPQNANLESAVSKEMQRRVKEMLPKLNEVVFSLFAPEAKNVYLVGEFNQWQMDESSRMEQRNGTWTKKLALAPGKYRYRFVIDNTWQEDPANPLKESNPFGGLDSLIEA